MKQCKRDSKMIKRSQTANGRTVRRAQHAKRHDKRYLFGSRTAQTSVEFIVLAAFMLFAFSGFVQIVKERSSTVAQQSRQAELQAVSDAIAREVSNANRVHDGYQHNFNLPSRINGQDYTISVYGSSELVIRTPDEEYIVFLPSNVTVTDYASAPVNVLVPGTNTIKKNTTGISVKTPATGASTGTNYEHVTCTFRNARTTAYCFALPAVYVGYSCAATGIGPEARNVSCAVTPATISGPQGTRVQFYSSGCSLGPSQEVIIDGVDQTLTFIC